MKVAIMTDSNSGITQNEAKENNLFVLPMPFTIKGIDYKEDVNLNQEQFYELIEEKDTQVFTSQPSVSDLTELWDTILNDYDELVHIPMSSGLSGSYQTAVMLSHEDQYEGKVFVADTGHVSVIERTDVYEALKLSKEGKSGKEIKELLENNSDHFSVYITVPSLEHLKRGGRVSPAAATLGGLLKIKPILAVKKENVDKFETARTMKKAKKIMIDTIKQDIIDHNLGDDCFIYSAYSKDIEGAKEFAEELKEAFPHNEIIVQPLTMSLACHIGPGGIGIGAQKRITKND